MDALLESQVLWQYYEDSKAVAAIMQAVHSLNHLLDTAVSSGLVVNVTLDSISGLTSVTPTVKVFLARPR